MFYLKNLILVPGILQHESYGVTTNENSKRSLADLIEFVINY